MAKRPPAQSLPAACREEYRKPPHPTRLIPRTRLMIWLDTADNSQARQVRPTHAYEVLRLHRRKVIAAIEDPPVIVKILSRLGLPTRAPPHAPARLVDLFQTI